MTRAYMSEAGENRARMPYVGDQGQGLAIREAERILADVESGDPTRPTLAYARIHSDRTIGPVYVAQAFDDLAADLRDILPVLDDLAQDAAVDATDVPLRLFDRNRATLAAMEEGRR